MTDPSTMPVGSLACYGGDLSVAANKAALLTQGWIPCDGTLYSVTDYPALFAAIGNSHGGTSTTFNVPQMQNRIPRGVDGIANNDPDSSGRTAAATGGATGNRVGSLQTSATALPRQAWSITGVGTHTHTYDRVNTNMHEAWEGSSEDAARWADTNTTDNAGAHFHTVTGGDPTTMPKNLALYWIIRATVGTPVAGATPAGTICGYGGASTTPPAGWLYCNGMAQAIQTPPQALASVIGFNYGGDGTSVFDLPDFRGRFQRGTAHGVSIDPDTDSRGPSQTGGAQGDSVGSAQSFATASPANPFVANTTGDHVHNCSRVPGDAHNAAVGASGSLAKNIMRLPDNATTTTESGAHGHTLTGGDDETRPENIYIDWLIAAQDTSDAPPIGAVMSFAGDVTDLSIQSGLIADGWYPCTGGTVRKSSASAPLYAVIGDAFTLSPNVLTYSLPDLRGLFVAGVGGTRLRGAEQLTSQTGSPANAFVTSTDGDHAHQITGTYPDDQEVDIVEGFNYVTTKGTETPSSTAGAHTHTIGATGGDSESRPENVYVDYIIRFR